MTAPQAQPDGEGMPQPSEPADQRPLPLFEDWSPQMSTAECVTGDWTSPRRVPCGELPIHPGAGIIQLLPRAAG